MPDDKKACVIEGDLEARIACAGDLCFLCIVSVVEKQLYFLKEHSTISNGLWGLHEKRNLWKGKKYNETVCRNDKRGIAGREGEARQRV